jgi:pimeloyl-ACP methyl ester carboxylesterase
MTQSRRSDPVPLTIERDDVQLAGSLWTPDHREPLGLVVLWPGSGPSDRHNDVYFPPIRAEFLTLGVAVCSFDKRGAGHSTGTWLNAGIDVQADDALAAADLAGTELPRIPVGFFGHSQGGWVVLDAAARRPGAAFVVTNSGPGVTPATQERHATLVRLAEHARDPAEFADALRCFELAVACLGADASFDSFVGYVERAGLTHVFRRAELFSFPLDDPDVWPYATVIFDHDPRPAMRSLAVPTLALLGADDPIVPVDASVAAYESCVRSDLLTVAVLAGGDHRMHHDGRLVDDYFRVLDDFVGRALAGREPVGHADAG